MPLPSKAQHDRPRMLLPMTDDISTNIQPGTPEAIWASRAIRQLVTARLGAGAPNMSDPNLDVFFESLRQLLGEIFEGADVQEQHLERVSYLLFAASLYGALAVGMAAAAPPDHYEVPPESERVEEILSAIAVALEQGDEHL